MREREIELVLTKKDFLSGVSLPSLSEGFNVLVLVVYTKNRLMLT